MMNQFTWVPYFEELLNVVCTKYDKDSLCNEVQKIFGQIEDQPEKDQKAPLDEIDPLTFIAMFNRGMTDKNRIGFCVKAKEIFNLNSHVPSDFTGIPVFNNMLTWFFEYKYKRADNIIDDLWTFAKDFNENKSINPVTFDKLLTFPLIGLSKLTQFLLICCPNNYYSCDSKSLKLLYGDKARREESYEYYIKFMNDAKEKYPDHRPYAYTHKAYELSIQKSVNQNDDLESFLRKVIDAYIDVIEDFRKDKEQYSSEKRKLLNENLSNINKELLNTNDEITKIANIKAKLHFHSSNDRIELCFLPLNSPVSTTSAFVSLHYQKEEKEELRFFYMKCWTGDNKKVFSSENYKNLEKQQWEQLILENYKSKEPFEIKRWSEKDLVNKIMKIPSHVRKRTKRIDDYLYNCGYLRKILSYNTQEDSKKEIINILISMLKDYEKLIYPEAFDQSGFFVSSKSPNQSSLINEEQNMKNEFKIPLNQILYGPPGTGKTYNTAIEALRIIMDKEDFQQLDLTDRTSVMEKYRHYKEKGQIKFITFHQSYSYEDFVEGIKPIMDSDEVKYEIKPGVLKIIANLAKSEYISPANSQIDIDIDNRRVFRVYLNELYDECIEKNILKYEKLYATDEIFNQLEPDDLILVYSTSVIKAIGLINSKNEDNYNVEWLIKDESIPREKISKKTFLGRRVCQLSKESVDFEELKQLVKPSANKIKRNYVLIIDEINRGNISKIMGELITLLEEDKRQGQENEISSILPYSGEEFILPSNLYIIGTMNTADRSIALMDIALRRRFTFKELMPDSALVKETINNNGETINLTRVFERLNKKITILLDRDHQIGHSFFMPHKVYDIKTLKDAWFKSLLPLLNEYFYCDWQKLKLIIPPFIKNLLEDNDDLKISLDDYETSEEELFEFKKPEEFTEEEFFRAIKALES